MLTPEEKIKHNLEAGQRWRDRNREKLRERDRLSYTREKRWVKHIKKVFGLTPEQYNDMLEKQNFKCAICGKPPEESINPHGKKGKLDIDHDHETNQIRALLCSQCNKGLGDFKDSIELVRKALTYLEHYAK